MNRAIVDLNENRAMQLLQELEDGIDQHTFSMVDKFSMFVDAQVFQFLVRGLTSGYTMLIIAWYCLKVRREVATQQPLSLVNQRLLINQHINNSIANHQAEQNEEEMMLENINVRDPPVIIFSANIILTSMIESRACVMRMIILIQSMMNPDFMLDINYNLALGGLDLTNDDVLNRIREGITAALNTGLQIISE